MYTKPAIGECEVWENRPRMTEPGETQGLELMRTPGTGAEPRVYLEATAIVIVLCSCSEIAFRFRRG